MSELTTINQIKKPSTLKSLFQDLKTLLINEEDTLLVRSSFSNLGWTCGRVPKLRSPRTSRRKVIPQDEWANPRFPWNGLRLYINRYLSLIRN